MKKILLNNEEHSFSAQDLPMLISGAHKTGSSHLSIILMAQLFKLGEKIVFFTAFPMAKEMFLEEVGAHKGIGVINSVDDIELQKDEKAIIIKSGDVELFHKVIDELDDLKERIVFLKNIDEYGAGAYLPVSAHEKILFQGDIDKSSFGESILEREIKTKIYFTQSELDIDNKLQSLDQYQAELFAPESKGLVTTVGEE